MTTTAQSGRVGALLVFGLALLADAIAEGRVATRVGSRALVAVAGVGLLGVAGLAARDGTAEEDPTPASADWER